MRISDWSSDVCSSDLQRFPDGVGAESFFQKRVPQGAPEWLRTTTMSTPNGTTSNAMVLEDLAHVAWAVNMGCLGFHPWPCRADDPRSEEHTSELQSLMRISYAVFCLKKKKN